MYNAIVVGTDGSETATRAVVHAADLAAVTGARLHIATVENDVLANVVGRDTNSEHDGPNVFDSVIVTAANLARSRGADVLGHKISADVVEGLCALAEDLGADLLVIGNRGMHGFQRFFVSSVPDAISHKAPCSVLIVDTTSASKPARR